MTVKSLFLVKGTNAGVIKPSLSVCFLLQNVRIDPNSIAFSMWKDVPVPFYLSAYFFEVMNPEEIRQGDKPVVNQRGPYVYRSGIALGMC